MRSKPIQSSQGNEMPFRNAATRTLAVSVWAILLASPCAAIDRAKLQEFFAAPYSVGARDGDLPIWPIFKTTSSGDELIAYVFEFTDFEPAPNSPHAGIDRLVAVRPSGEFLEVHVFDAKPAPIWNWFRKKPAFDFIRRDQAGALTLAAGTGSSAHQNAVEHSRDFVRARLSIAVESQGNPFPEGAPKGGVHSAATGTVLTALAVSIILFLATLFRWRPLVLSTARDERKGDRADRSPSSLEFDT
jgi:hypothetical protein